MFALSVMVDIISINPAFALSIQITVEPSTLLDYVPTATTATIYKTEHASLSIHTVPITIMRPTFVAAVTKGIMSLITNVFCPDLSLI